MSEAMATTARQRRWRCSALVGAAALAASNIVLTAPAAHAAAPANDDWGSPTAVGEWPFEDSVDTTEATTDSVNPFGLGRYKSRSIWYSLAPAEDARVLFTAQGTDYLHKIKLYHADDPDQTPDEWTPMRGQRGSDRGTRAAIAKLEGAEQYYLVIGAHNRAAATGTAHLLVRDPAHVSFGVAGARLDMVDGSAVLRGTLTSDQPVVVYGELSLRQVVGKHVVGAVAGFSRLDLVAGKPTRWRLRFADNRPYKHGRARLTWTWSVFDAGAQVPVRSNARNVVVLE